MPSWQVRPIARRVWQSGGFCQKQSGTWDGTRPAVGTSALRTSLHRSARGQRSGHARSLHGARSHLVIAKVVMPREMLEERVAEQRDQVAAAALGTKPRTQHQQVGKRVFAKVGVAQVGANVDLHGEAETIEAAGGLDECIEAVQHHLKLQLVKPD